MHLHKTGAPLADIWYKQIHKVETKKLELSHSYFCICVFNALKAAEITNQGAYYLVYYAPY